MSPTEKGGEDVIRDNSEKLYEAYYMRVFSYTMTLTGDRHQAEELTQETFFRAFTKNSSFRGESDEITWLCAIAKNLFVDEKRRPLAGDNLLAPQFKVGYRGAKLLQSSELRTLGVLYGLRLGAHRSYWTASRHERCGNKCGRARSNY